MRSKVSDMFYVVFLIGSLTVFQAESDTIQSMIHKYFKSDGVLELRKEWELYRKPIEHSIAIALKETMGFHGLNVYIRKTLEPLALGYYHNDNQIRLVLKDVHLHEIPRFWMPEVQFSLASNVFKLQTTLSKMIIHADYSLMRNKSRIIYEISKQNPFESSPFLFQQVQDVGSIALSMDGCKLSGFGITTLSGDSINLGYDHFKLSECDYTIEIYRPGEDSPPVIAKYRPQRDDDWCLGIKDLVIKPIRDELNGKLQGAMLSFINTTSLFNDKLQGYIDMQKKIMTETATFLTDVNRNLNRITIERNHGAIELDDHYVYWDNDKKSEFVDNKGKDTGESLHLMQMVLTGLDTMYSAHSGGPYKMDTIMIGEEMRFSSLQVHGYFKLTMDKNLDDFWFTAEINDLNVDLQMDVRLGESKASETSVLKGCSYKILQVSGFRRMVLTLPSYMHDSVESLIYGHLLNVLPKVIRVHLKAILREALLPTTTTPLPTTKSSMDLKGVDGTSRECSEGEEINNIKAKRKVPPNTI